MNDHLTHIPKHTYTHTHTHTPTQITAEERAFIENEVEKLCEISNEYEMYKNKDLPQPVWDYIRKNGFLGMIIDKQYGGKGFSAHGHALVVQKVSTRSQSVGVSVMVPNSLGPGELLKRYGTQAEKDYYLPKLANGELIPCFGLTGPASGSDAASMRDTAIVVEENGQLGVRATFKKRYITLAPVAGCVGLAVNLKDPKGLLKGKGKEGISIFLLERDLPGLRMGPRHDPLAAFFMNGTVEGENVFIPIEKLLGGQERAGYGWNMLMDCLAEGRSISLPAGAIAIGKLSCTAVGAYARIRKQFKVPIAELEGVQEHLARIAGHTYIITAAQGLTNSMLNQHEQPAVISAIMKQQCTHRGRIIVNDAMDVVGGAGICLGPNNFLGTNYMATPIAITVEGANTLTRSLIQFGQVGVWVYCGCGCGCGCVCVLASADGWRSQFLCGFGCGCGCVWMCLIVSFWPFLLFSLTLTYSHTFIHPHTHTHTHTPRASCAPTPTSSPSSAPSKQATT